MKQLVSLFLLLGTWTAIPAEVSAQEIARKILGVNLHMTKEQVHERLKQIGKFAREETKRQEVWEVRDESYSHVIIGFRQDGKLRYVTAVAREDKDAKRVHYDRIGNLKEARQAGDPKINNFAYEWNLPANNGEPSTMVSARGRDPKFLTTYSLKNLDAESASEKDD